MDISFLVRLELPMPAAAELTELERQIILSLSSGLSDEGISQQLSLTLDDVKTAIDKLIHQFRARDSEELSESAEMNVFSPRARLVFLSIKSGAIRAEEVRAAAARFETGMQGI
jgi:DNA-binding NarL/FixJ family response regulator